MSCSPSARTIVCTEVFDENSQPSEEEIRDYAAKIGIDVASEAHLLHLARDGLMQALPPGWKPCFDEELRSWYYFNFRTGESRWEHPLDDVYRSLVRKGRSESISSAGDDDSKTSLKDDLRSYEEADAGDMKKTSLQLAPLKKTPVSPLATTPSPTTGDAKLRLDLRVDQQRRGADVPSPSARIDIDKMGTASLLDARNRPSLPQEKHPRNLHQGGRGGLTLTGGGAIFLKSRHQQEQEEGPRGILREETTPSAPEDQKQRCRGQDVEDRKSVRFNILDVRFASAGTQDEEEASDEEEEEEDEDADECAEDDAAAEGHVTDERQREAEAEAERRQDASRSLQEEIPPPTADRREAAVALPEDGRRCPLLPTGPEERQDADVVATEEDGGQGDAMREVVPATGRLFAEDVAEEDRPPSASSESPGGVTSPGDAEEPSSETASSGSSSRDRERLRQEHEMRLQELRAQLALSEERLQARLEAESQERIALFREELLLREAALRAEAEERHREALAVLRRQLDAEAADVAEQRRLLQRHSQELREQTAALEAARKEHEEEAANLRTLKAQLLLQEESLRRDHGARVEELRKRLEVERDAASRELEDSHRGYEKLRCEKRLLEDKYRSLKEKYLRLYTDVKVSIEKRKRRDAGSAASGHSRKTDLGAALDNVNVLHPAAAPGDDDDDDAAHSRSSGGGATAAESRDRRRRRREPPTSNDNDDAAATENNNGADPVENLRRQLRSLEDLEEQFPASPLTHADTYLRYPFADHSGAAGGGGGAELEFFRHRIHLERDSVRRAKDFLRVQRDSFQARRSELRQRERGGGSSARSMLDQLYKEERELTDMEVSLHRTKSLLGEKIIRLRHLEQSLERAGDRASGAATLSDVSSHSGSSGFSSSATPEAAPWRSLRAAHYHEPTEIVHSLESLNTEIRDIWQVLHRRRKDAGAPPPPSAWPSQQLQDRSLVERTRSLRDWLRQARMDSPAAPANAASKAL